MHKNKTALRKSASSSALTLNSDKTLYAASPKAGYFALAALGLSALVGAAALKLYFAALKYLRERKELVWREECYRTVTQNSELAVFDYDYRSKKLSANSNFTRLFGENIAHRGLLSSAVIYPDDAEKYGILIGAAKDSGRAESILRLKTTDSRYIWCKVFLTVFNDISGKTLRMMGLIINVDKETRALDDMSKLAATDRLTGLYNKAAAEDKVREALFEDSGKYGCALIMMDIDDFKRVNDNYGHAYGDALLKAVGSALRSIFRSDDISGRAGGDEFMIFIRQLPSREALVDILIKAMASLRRIKTEAQSNTAFSYSMGAAYAAKSEKNFERLYYEADKALYAAKKSGKNAFTVYRGEGEDF